MIYQKLKDLLEIQNPCLLPKNWYLKPTPPDMQFEERVFQTPFSISADELYKWNIDGLFEQKIMSHMSDDGIAYQNNHDIDQSDIVNLLVTGFSGTPRKWWDSYPTGLPILLKILVAVFLMT